jgi:tRNA/tmRNA/rRNA uracil-C5-methylase (TrmA/RlmC/RlmD family)
VHPVSGSYAGFRLRARLAIRGRRGSPKVGLFELGTHRVVHIPNCRVQHPLINRVANVVRRALVETGVSSYSDKVHLGLARYLQVAVERASQTAQVVMVANSATADPLIECFALIRERLGGELHSLWFNSNVERSNTILGPAFDIAQRIIEHVRERIPSGSRVAEFYAGVGAIGLSVLERVSEICLNEVSPHSLRGLALGIEDLVPADRAKVSVIPGTAASASALDAASRSQVVIADPPRKGLDAELTAHLRNQPPDRLIYISCGLDSFLADVARLTSAGTMRVAEITAFNLMPFTEHVETVARLERC